MASRRQFAGHCKRRKGSIVSSLITWPPTQGKRTSGGPTKTYVDQLQADTGYTTGERKLYGEQEIIMSHHWNP